MRSSRRDGATRVNSEIVSCDPISESFIQGVNIKHHIAKSKVKVLFRHEPYDPEFLSKIRTRCIL
jgi:hypothetical protein